MNMRKSTLVSPRGLKDSITRQSEKKQSDYRKWTGLQLQVNDVFNETQTRIGFYIEFLEYLSTINARKEPIIGDQKVSFRQSETLLAQEPDIVEKFRQLKEVQTKVNEKVQILEQKLGGGLTVDMNINESYYEILSSKFNQCRDIFYVTEKDILQEIESKIDINKEEETIEYFIKEKRRTSPNQSHEIFSIYKLKSKVMNEKIEKIKRQFEDQSYTVESIRKIFEDRITNINSDIHELREIGSIDRPELITKNSIDCIEVEKIRLDANRKLDLMQQSQSQLQSKIEQLTVEITELRNLSNNLNKGDFDQVKQKQLEILQKMQLNQTEQTQLQIQNSTQLTQITSLKLQNSALQTKFTDLELQHQQDIQQYNETIKVQNDMNQELQKSIVELHEKLKISEAKNQETNYQIQLKADIDKTLADEEIPATQEQN